MVWAMENLIISLDKARSVVIGTRIGTLEQVPGRIAASITPIGC